MVLDMVLPSSSRLAGLHRRSVRRLLCQGLESLVLSVVCRSRSKALIKRWGWSYACEIIDILSFSKFDIGISKRELKLEPRHDE